MHFEACHLHTETVLNISNGRSEEFGSFHIKSPFISIFIVFKWGNVVWSLCDSPYSNDKSLEYAMYLTSQKQYLIYFGLDRLYCGSF